MGWGRYFLLGDLGQQLDIHDRQRDMEQLREHINSQSRHDSQQDDWIRYLQAENQELKVYVTSLVRLLLSKKILTQSEVEQMVDLVERTNPTPNDS